MLLKKCASLFVEVQIILLSLLFKNTLTCYHIEKLQKSRVEGKGSIHRWLLLRALLSITLLK